MSRISTDEARKNKIVKRVDKADSFLVIYKEKNGNVVQYSDFNIAPSDIITMCEVVKSKILKKVVK